MTNYVKEHKGFKVPEGATHYQGSGQNHYEGFFKLSDDGWLFANAGCSTWHGQKAFKRSLSSHAVPLPQEPESKEWNGEGLPPIGCGCECYVWTNNNGGERQWVVLPVIGHSSTSKSEFCKGRSGIIVDSCERDGNFILCDEFRPLKTQEQKDREAFIEKAIEVYYAGAHSGDMAAALFDAGFKAPEGE